MKYILVIHRTPSKRAKDSSVSAGRAPQTRCFQTARNADACGFVCRRAARSTPSARSAHALRRVRETFCITPNDRPPRAANSLGRPGSVSVGEPARRLPQIAKLYGAPMNGRAACARRRGGTPFGRALQRPWSRQIRSFGGEARHAAPRAVLIGVASTRPASERVPNFPSKVVRAYVATLSKRVSRKSWSILLAGHRGVLSPIMVFSLSADDRSVFAGTLRAKTILAGPARRARLMLALADGEDDPGTPNRAGGGRAVFKIQRNCLG